MINEQIPELKIERMTDEQGALILLEQDNGGNVECVAIHPIHLRYMAETFGLVATSDPEGAKTIATLTRRLGLLQRRIAHLSDYLANHSDREHANLDHEITYAAATADLAAEFCAELDGAA